MVAMGVVGIMIYLAGLFLYYSAVSKTDTGPIVPPFDGAEYFGASADMTAIGWNDPTTGKTRYFVKGVEVGL